MDRKQQTRTFKTTTGSLGVMRDWLVEEGVTIAAMESTSTYWKPPFYCLEEVMEVWLLNAAHMKAVPGRKTDVRDAEWIAQLLEHGLLTPSFVPPPPIRQLRMLTRYRVQLKGDRTRETVRLELMLEDASIKLSTVASSLTTVSARAMLAAMIEGETDARVLAEMAKGRMRSQDPGPGPGAGGALRRPPRPAGQVDPGPARPRQPGAGRARRDDRGRRVSRGPIRSSCCRPSRVWARAASVIAVTCGTPDPETTLVVQIDPGPMPTLIPSTPSSIRSRAPS